MGKIFKIAEFVACSPSPLSASHNSGEDDDADAPLSLAAATAAGLSVAARCGWAARRQRFWLARPARSGPPPHRPMVARSKRETHAGLVRSRTRLRHLTNELCTPHAIAGRRDAAAWRPCGRISRGSSYFSKFQVDCKQPESLSRTFRLDNLTAPPTNLIDRNQPQRRSLTSTR